MTTTNIRATIEPQLNIFSGLWHCAHLLDLADFWFKEPGRPDDEPAGQGLMNNPALKYGQVAQTSRPSVGLADFRFKEPGRPDDEPTGQGSGQSDLSVAVFRARGVASYFP